MSFEPTRADGRADWRVVYDLVRNESPGATWAYGDLIAALAVGVTDRAIDKPAVYAAVGRCNKTLLREKRRYLRVERHKGYAMISSDEHVTVALDRKASAREKMRRGLEILQQVHVGEMTEARRQEREGHLLVFSAISDALDSHERRLGPVEDAIQTLLEGQREVRERIEALEGKTEDAE